MSLGSSNQEVTGTWREGGRGEGGGKERGREGGGKEGGRGDC